MATESAMTGETGTAFGGAQVVDEPPSLRRMVREVWAARSLVPRIGIRVTVKGYSGTKLGRTWLWLRPSVSILGMSLLFGAVLDAPSEGLPYILFLLIGTQAWMCFERSVFWATRSFDVYRRITRNFRIPLMIVPISAAIPASIEFTVVGALAFGALTWFSIADHNLYLVVGPGLLVAVGGYLLAYLVGMSVGFWTATLNAFARDVRILMIFVLQLWLYVTPVIYPRSALPSGLDLVVSLNPVTAPVEMVKWGLLDVGSVRPLSLIVSIAFVLIVGTSGAWFLTVKSWAILRRQPPGAEDDEDM
jgi:lipopolysaccharide transport system permease protein